MNIAYQHRGTKRPSRKLRDQNSKFIRITSADGLLEKECGVGEKGVIGICRAEHKIFNLLPTCYRYLLLGTFTRCNDIMF